MAKGGMEGMPRGQGRYGGHATWPREVWRAMPRGTKGGMEGNDTWHQGRYGGRAHHGFVDETARVLPAIRRLVEGVPHVDILELGDLLEGVLAEEKVGEGRRRSEKVGEGRRRSDRAGWRRLEDVREGGGRLEKAREGCGRCVLRRRTHLAEDIILGAVGVEDPDTGRQLRVGN